jgi:hypothetical protein
MADINTQVEQFLQALVDELAIPESRYEQAETSYKSLGDWFHRDESTISGFDPAVYVQGSFRLGTAIRPINDTEEYDVDSVCELKRLTKSNLSQFELKQLLGREIRAYHDAKGMTKPVREGRRCWILDYADGAQFHMDIVPALPNGAEQRLLLEKAQFDARWADTAIAITDREVPAYMIRTLDWPRSNPKGYGAWADGCCPGPTQANTGGISEGAWRYRERRKIAGLSRADAIAGGGDAFEEASGQHVCS